MGGRRCIPHDTSDATGGYKVGAQVCSQQKSDRGVASGHMAGGYTAGGRYDLGPSAGTTTTVRTDRGTSIYVTRDGERGIAHSNGRVTCDRTTETDGYDVAQCPPGPPTGDVQPAVQGTKRAEVYVRGGDGDIAHKNQRFAPQSQDNGDDYIESQGDGDGGVATILAAGGYDVGPAMDDAWWLEDIGDDPPPPHGKEGNAKDGIAMSNDEYETADHRRAVNQRGGGGRHPTGGYDAALEDYLLFDALLDDHLQAEMSDEDSDLSRLRWCPFQSSSREDDATSSWSGSSSIFTATTDGQATPGNTNKETGGKPPPLIEIGTPHGPIQMDAPSEGHVDLCNKPGEELRKAALPPPPWVYLINSSCRPVKPFILWSDEEPAIVTTPCAPPSTATTSQCVALPVYQRWASAAWVLLLCSFIISFLRRKGLPRFTPGYACWRGHSRPCSIPPVPKTLLRLSATWRRPMRI